jgi:hypothetical protein
MLGAIDKCHVDLFKVLCRRIVNDRRGIGEALPRKGETGREASRLKAAGMRKLRHDG